MKASELISKHFSFSANQLHLFDQLQEVILEWNQQINVVSRKETEFFAERHVLHSLAIYKFLPFTPGSTVLDLGTGVASGYCYARSVISIGRFDR